jgi:dihydropyrimidinase
MTFDLVIRGGRIVTAGGSFNGDLAVQDGRIAGIGDGIGPGAQEVDATGRLVLPGGVDPHCHIEQMSGMGLMNADTFETATRSAAMGGTTSVISFAAQAHGQGLGDVIDDYAARARRGAMIDHAFHLTVTDTSVDGFSDDLATLIAAGHRSIKIFTTYNIALSDAEILRVMTEARQHGALVCVHAENDALIGWTRAGLLAAGLTRPEHHALSHPRMAEIEAVGRICRFAEYLDQPVMLFHISTRDGAAIVRDARLKGAPVWAETCPHYLLMTDEVLQAEGLEGAKVMCSPPQRKAGDQQALWQALERGELQVISSDHAPYRYDETGKLSAGPTARFDQIANGLPGLETRLPLLFDAMVSRDGPGVEKFVDLTATAPAQLYGLPGKGQLAEGMDADIVLWDPARQVTYGDNDLHDNVGYNPWAGRTVTGWPEQVFLRGALLVDRGEFLGTPGQGRWIDRPDLATPPSGVAAPEVSTIREAGG